ncbi:CoA pyrophosphatase [Caldimonas tepidiphila]|uniref:CoA pyrophosphatase n=1 Tax=Caldimonas tepidiphila TaxID=2315841 RepID=UPI000E5AA372|nr:CoA pyrophosphatase [Caldimonas tepidiphila]
MALITDPRSVPVLGTDTHLPPVPAERLQPDALRERFRHPPADWQPELAAEPRLYDRPPVPAAVLVPIVLREQPTVLLTQRTAHLRAHAGQISFPGGRSEPQDADAAATALREAEEETGLDRRHVEVIGTMPPYTTVTAFVVTPVVALVRPGFELRPDPFEVDEVFEVPLAFLMQPAHHRRHVFEFEGGRREFLSMPWPHEDGGAGRHRYFIWGATAAMLRNLYRFLML